MSLKHALSELKTWVKVGLIIAALMVGAAWIFGFDPLHLVALLATLGVVVYTWRATRRPLVIIRRVGMAATVASVIVMYDRPTNFEVGDLAVVTLGILLLVGLFILIKDKLAEVFGWFTGDDSGHIRGAKLTDAKQVARMLRRQESRFSVGGVPVPVELETRGFLFAGAPGTGKSQALTSALDALRAAGARAIVADASGVYLSRYYFGGDILLNPFDARTTKWSPLAEIETAADIPALARSIIPDAEGSAREWNDYARTALEAILDHCFTTRATNGQLFHLACVADSDELRPVFAGSGAAALIAQGNERMWGSVRAILGTYLRPIQYLDPDTGADGFSIRRHIVGDERGWIYLTYQQQHRDALRTLIGAQLDIAARAVLSLPPDLGRRIVFALDELPLLGKVSNLIDLLTNGRKHGAVVFAGLQTIAQLRDTYGRETAQTLLSCLGSWLVLRVTDAETAEYMSRYLGEEEKTRIVHSGGRSEQSLQFGSSRTESWQEQIVKDRVVMPSELQSLPDMVGIFNLAGPAPSARVQIPLAPQRTARKKAFVPAPVRSRAVTAQPAFGPTPESDLPRDFV